MPVKKGKKDITSSLIGNYRDRRGERIGKLTILRPTGRTKDNHVIWYCKCDCGNFTEISSGSITNKKKGTRSCGCLRLETGKNRRVPWNARKKYYLKGPGDEYSLNGWKKALLKLRGNKCEQCGWDKASCDTHHILPRNKGGKNTLNNGIVLCPNCHRIISEKVRDHP